MKYKRNIIILLLAFLIFVTLKYIQINMFKANKQVDIYIANTYIQRGDKITKDKVKKVKINYNLMENLGYIDNLEILENYVAKYDLLNGQIILKEILENNDEYIARNITNELISIDVTNAYDFTSYQISKDSVINIYYTGKTEFAENIINNMGNTNIVISNDNGYVSAKLLENVKIKNIYDKYGNLLLDSTNKKENELMIDSIVIEVDTSTAVNINNLKKYGEFSITVLK